MDYLVLPLDFHPKGVDNSRNCVRFTLQSLIPECIKDYYFLEAKIFAQDTLPWS